MLHSMRVSQRCFALLATLVLLAHVKCCICQSFVPSVEVTKARYVEYMHVPKCGTLKRSVCDSAPPRGLPCLPKTELLNRKCGLTGEHCDWTAKHSCAVGKTPGKRIRLSFWTLLRDPVSRVRSEYNYFYAGRQNGRLNLTDWVSLPNNWSHNRMARMLHGVRTRPRTCKIASLAEARFWSRTLKVPQVSPKTLNLFPVIAEIAKQNLAKHFFMWGLTKDAARAFCLLKLRLGPRISKLTFDNFLKPRPSKTPVTFDAQMDSEVRNLILKFNVLDDIVYKWGQFTWEEQLALAPSCHNLSSSQGSNS